VSFAALVLRVDGDKPAEVMLELSSATTGALR